MNMKKLDLELAEYAEKNKIYGTLRVTLKEKIVYQRHFGYANMEDKTPFTDKSMFTFYSMTKPLCAIGLLKLYDKGLVDLDAHPSKYVPEAAGFDSRVTIRQMLCHVSGMPDFTQTDPKYVEAHPVSNHASIRQDIIDISKYPNAFVPGEKDYYANINFALAGLICENLTGVPYEEYMEKEVLRPIGMKTAVIDYVGLEVENRVSGHELDEAGNVHPVVRNCNFMFGAGDVLGTADDVYCLNLAYKNKLLLKPETWEMVTTPNPVSRMGMGNTVDEWHGKKRIVHNGGHVGFRTLHIYLPEDDFDLIILSNSGYGNARYEMGEIVHNAFYGDDGTIGEVIEMDKGYAN